MEESGVGDPPRLLTYLKKTFSGTNIYKFTSLNNSIRFNLDIYRSSSKQLQINLVFSIISAFQNHEFSIHKKGLYF